MKTLDRPVPPGGVIGIIGGGQLARMLSLAAARLGLKTLIYNDDADAPAFQVTQLAITAPYDDRNMLAGLANVCDVVTFEFENLPADAIAFLADQVPVRPNPECAGGHPGSVLTGKTLCRPRWACDRAVLRGGVGRRSRARPPLIARGRPGDHQDQPPRL